MSQRARSAQLGDESSEQATLSEADARRTTLDQGRHVRQSSRVERDPSRQYDDESPTEANALDELLGDAHVRPTRRNVADLVGDDVSGDGEAATLDGQRTSAQGAPAAPATEAVDVEFIVTPPPSPSPPSSPPSPPARASERRKKAKRGTDGTSEASPRRGLHENESVWDAVEDRYRAEGHWTDLIEMYLQRVEGTQDTDVKGSLFLRIGQVLQDELDDPQQALDAFVEALLLHPDDAEARKAVEAIARARSWWGELLTTLKRELASIKSNARAAAICELALGWAETELKSASRAEPFLDHLRKVDPGHPVIHRRLAAMYGERSAWGSQRESLERALLRARSESERLELHVLLGELNERRFLEHADAAKHYDVALGIDPGSIKALEGLERICRVQMRFGDLLEVLERELEATSDDEARVEILVRIADVYERHFVRPQNAVPALEEAVRLDPRHDVALAALERCYQATRSWPELARILELRVRATDRASEQNAIAARLAELLELKMDDPDGAALAWRRVWDQDPSSERALSELARLAERSEDWPAAAAYRGKLADLAETPEASAKIHVAIAEMLSAPERDPKLARVHYEKATLLHPNTTEAWEALEKEARRTGDTRRAGLFLEKRAASTESPRVKAQLFVELAQEHAAQGDVAAAELAFERAIKADPTNEVAAEAMLATHVRERRWAEARPLCDVLIASTTRDLGPERTFALLRLATRIATELGQKDRALSAALNAYRAYPSLESTQDLLDACHALRDDAAALAECAAELDAITATAMEMAPAYVARLARIRLAQGAESDAMALFSKALIHDSDQREALEGLGEILVKRGDWERASAFKQKLAHATTEPEEQFTLLVEAGELWAHRAKNMPMAALAFEEALALKPRDQPLLHTMLWLYGELACWEKLVETLRAVADIHEEPSAKAKSVYAMAMVVRDHLGDLRRTAVLLEEVLDLDATRLDAFERVVRVHTETRDWMELKHAYGRMLRRLKSAGDVDLRHALFFQLGLIYRDRLGDAARALDAFRAAQRLKPEASDVRKGMIELFVVTDQLDEGINMVRAALKSHPLDAALYGELYELSLRKRAFDRAWCAVDAMVTLGAQLDPEKGRFYADYPPPVLSHVPGTLTATAWRSHILHAELDPALTTIFALVTPAILRARVALVPFQQLRASLGEPLRMNGAVAHDVLQSVADASEILSFQAPSLHARKGQTLPLALAPAKNAMFVSLEACEALASDALAFVVGKRLAELRPELAARAACPSIAELKGLVHLAVQLADPKMATPSTGNQAFDKALAQSITREERQGLRAALAAAMAQGSELDIVRWSQLADVSTARVGLLLCGRIDAAKRGMLSDPQMPGDLTPRDKLAQLLVFSVSDEYADLRYAIGMSVDANAAA